MLALLAGCEAWLGSKARVMLDVSEVAQPFSWVAGGHMGAGPSSTRQP